MRHGVAGGQFHRGRRVGRAQHLGHPGEHRRVQVHRVVGRQVVGRHRARRQPVGVGDLRGVDDQVAVAQQHRFGFSGGAAGEVHARGLAEIGRWPLVRRLRVRHELTHRRFAAARVLDHDPAQARDFGQAGGHPGTQQRDLRIHSGQQAGGDVAGQEGIEHRHHATGPECAEVPDGEPRVQHGVHGDHRTGRRAQGVPERARPTRGGGLEFREGDRTVRRHHGRAIRRRGR